MRKLRDITPWDWIGVPALTVSIMLIAPVIYPTRAGWNQAINDEFGILELGTVAYCLIAIVFAALALRRARLMPKPMPAVLVIGLLAALYFGGEECSWGQTYFQWETPEAWAKENHQEETNLHNISGVFNELPRNIMGGAALVGGVILPLALKKRLENDDAPQSFWYWLIPNYRLAPIALLAVLSTVPEKLDAFEPLSYGWYALSEAGGELKEFAFAGVMMFYFMSIHHRAASLSAK